MTEYNWNVYKNKNEGGTGNAKKLCKSVKMKRFELTWKSARAKIWTTGRGENEIHPAPKMKDLS